MKYLKGCSQTYPSDAEHMSGRLAYRALHDDRQENHDTQEISVSQNFGKRHGSLKKRFGVSNNISAKVFHRDIEEREEKHKRIPSRGNLRRYFVEDPTQNR